MRKNIIPILMLLCALGCATVYTSIVTVTSVVDTGMRAWADVSAAGHSTAAIDAKVIAVHNQYRAACKTAEDALVAFKSTGDQAAYVQAFAIVKSTAADLIAIITPLIPSTTSVKLQTNLAKATKI